MEARLPSSEAMQQDFVEILVKAEWAPRSDPIVISPSDVSIEVERDFHRAAEANWPLIQFQRIAENGEQFYEVKAIDAQGDKMLLLTENRIEFAVLAAIARRTEQEPSTYAAKGGYISYEQITESEIVRKILGPAGLDVPTVRATIARLRARNLETPEWERTFPNLLLESTAYARGTRRKIKVLRLRARFEFKW